MNQIDINKLKGNAVPLLLLLILSLIFVACNGNAENPEQAGDEETTTTSSEDEETTSSDNPRLQEQQEADIVLDPEDLAASNTVFDPEITDGETLFVSYCAKCHGLGGLGDGPSVGSLRDPSGMNLTILQDRSDEELFNTITGGKGVEMPPWGLVLTEEQRNALVGYVRTLGES